MEVVVTRVGYSVKGGGGNSSVVGDASSISPLGVVGADKAVGGAEMTVFVIALGVVAVMVGNAILDAMGEDSSAATGFGFSSAGAGVGVPGVLEDK